MITAGIAGLILIGVFKFLDRIRQREDFDPQVDWWMAFVFVYVPSLLIFLLRIGLGIAELPQSLALTGYLFYFFVPFVMLKFMLGFESKRAVLFSIFVPIIVLLLEVLIVSFVGVESA